jgi:exopolysaccharide production protein ExoZ
MSIVLPESRGIENSLLSMPEPVIELDQEAPVADANQRVRYKLLDAWRGLAALAVVSLHGAVPLLGGSFKSLTENTAWGKLLYGALGVQFFFVISGYCIAGAAVQQLLDFGEAWPFVRARLRRIWPGYLASLFFALLLIGAHELLAKQGAIQPVESYVLFREMASPVWILSHLTLTQWPLHVKMLNGLYWTLNYEVAFYAIVALLLIPTWRLNRRGVLGAMHVLTIGSLALLVVKPELRFFPLDLWPLFG